MPNQSLGATQKATSRGKRYKKTCRKLCSQCCCTPEKKITQDRIGLRPIVVSTSITLSQSFLKSEKDATRPGRMPADLKKAHCCLTLTLISFWSDSKPLHYTTTRDVEKAAMLNFISFLAFGLGGQNGLKLLLLVTTDRALTVQLKDCQPHACCLC